MRDAAWYADHPAVRHIPAAAGAEWCPARLDLWTADRPFQPAAKLTKVKPILVFANEGRWIAECPDCHAAQLACATDLRFMCHCCGNGALEGCWRPIKWPGNRAALERALSSRPTTNRNWLPGETVALIRAENRAMGVG
ncbi:MAG TPA: hypothetical protein VGH54_10220 [Mycobacterium sp.]|jgi:hypothetical protein|uniref:hypothetical protein n=1 Tax=Mycobacterium sp. TaxID=1785 RepID=UPI002F41AB51